ncbi:hypothetical protein [Halobacillus halophilus]|uniref:hypothetical protein n=1 Tax=Halobacillus halophilus TaxID=1570 RepID=UPI001CD7DB3A|nr:hypothetical protein [Halobacillus halophilus]MCA1012821.1 hypothetical protein [Halobacillus halophilus]
MEYILKIKYSSSFSEKEFEKRFNKHAKLLGDFETVYSFFLSEDESKSDINQKDWVYGSVILNYNGNHAMDSNFVVSVLRAMDYQEFKLINVSDLI